MSTTTDPRRTIVLWFPDWPVTAAAHDAGIDQDTPLALLSKGLVFACSQSARNDGVVRGLRLREAQYRCTSLLTLDYDATLDARSFEPVIAAIEQTVPGVQLLRPGCLAMRARGPSRYYGGEAEAATALLATVAELGIAHARIGIADGPFSAEQAARALTQVNAQAKAHASSPTRENRRSSSDTSTTSTSTSTSTSTTVHTSSNTDAKTPKTENPTDTTTSILRVPPGASAAFIAPLPLSTVLEGRIATLLNRLGIRTLGELAALDHADVLRRFGHEGAHAHAKARANEGSSVIARTPPPELDLFVEFEPALDRIDQIAFAIRARAEEFIAALTARRLVCTGIRIELSSENSDFSSRSWLHPRWFSPNDVVDRIRWQLQGATSAEKGLTSALATLRVHPERLDSTGNHEEGLWGSGRDERVHHGLTRVQSMLGHEGVLTAVPTGGRMLRDRIALVPWGDKAPETAQQAAGARTKSGTGTAPGTLTGATIATPWPGSLPDPPPATVYQNPVPAAIYDADSVVVHISERGAPSAQPHSIASRLMPEPRAITAWAGPWPLVEKWWDPANSKTLHRFQVIDDTGDAWLVVRTPARWLIEARYD